MRTHIRELGNRYRLEDTEPNRHKQFRGEHPGLILHRLLGEQLPPDGESSLDKEQKKRALTERQAIFQSAINASANPEVRELYQSAFERWQKSLPELTAANCLQTLGRLIVGLGAESVLETGIRLHHTYGLPILPGSALKGLAAHYCDQVWGERESKFKLNGECHNLLFGTTKESGCIIFHDAWLTPDSPAPLKLDVMTPHHSGWNKVDDPEPPTDFDSPIPVPFLSVAGKFHVDVSWCGPSSDKALSWRDMAMDCLRDALFHWGIGGKTSSGYGRFDEETWKAETEQQQKQAEQKRIAAEKEAALAALSPIERSIQEFLDSKKSDTSSDSSKLVTAIKQNTWSDSADRIAVAQHVKAMLIAEKKWIDKGKDGERKKYLQGILGE